MDDWQSTETCCNNSLINLLKIEIELKLVFTFAVLTWTEKKSKFFVEMLTIIIGKIVDYF